MAGSRAEMPPPDEARRGFGWAEFRRFVRDPAECDAAHDAGWPRHVEPTGNAGPSRHSYAGKLLSTVQAERKLYACMLSAFHSPTATEPPEAHVPHRNTAGGMSPGETEIRRCFARIPAPRTFVGPLNAGASADPKMA